MIKQMSQYQVALKENTDTIKMHKEKQDDSLFPKLFTRALEANQLDRQRYNDKWRNVKSRMSASAKRSKSQKITSPRIRQDGYYWHGQHINDFKKFSVPTSQTFLILLKAKIFDQCVMTYEMKTWEIDKKGIIKLQIIQRAMEGRMLSIIIF